MTYRSCLGGIPVRRLISATLIFSARGANLLASSSLVLPILDNFISERFERQQADRSLCYWSRTGLSAVRRSGYVVSRWPNRALYAAGGPMRTVQQPSAGDRSMSIGM